MEYPSFSFSLSGSGGEGLPQSSGQDRQTETCGAICGGNRQAESAVGFAARQGRTHRFGGEAP